MNEVIRENRGLKKIIVFIFYPVVWIRRKYIHYRPIWLIKHRPKKMASALYKKAMGQELDWKNPKDLNAKINWLKFYGDRALWARCADKYAVRAYVEERGLGKLLVKLLGKWDRAEDIEWDKLPDKFILKMNNGSGTNYICNDKNSVNTVRLTEKFHRWLNISYASQYVEPHYGDIKPCVIAEELLDINDQDITSSTLIDYKVWSFNGEPLYIWVCHNRGEKGPQVATFDTHWNFRPEKSVYNEHYRKSQIAIPKPKCLDEMLEAASTLSKGHPEVRVDFYVVGGKCYFGEMTFTSLGGYMDFYTKEMLLEMGEKTDLTLVRNKI